MLRATYSRLNMAENPPPERIIHFRWNPVDGEPFGTGILRPLPERMNIGGEVRMSFLE
ncbi:MAG: hypothetical protein QXQ42_03660 [Candidatus Bathyarchaeia archaeon]